MKPPRERRTLDGAGPVAVVVIQSSHPGDGPVWPSGCRVAHVIPATRHPVLSTPWDGVGHGQKG